MAPEERGHLKQFDRLAAAAKQAENCWLLELIFFKLEKKNLSTVPSEEEQHS